VPLPAPEKKPEPPRPEPKPQDQLADVKPQKKPPPPQDDFQSLLKTLDKMKQQSPDKPEKPEKPKKPDDLAALEKTLQQMEKNVPSTAPQADQKVAIQTPNIAEQASASDKDFIRAHIERHWNFDAGARDAANLIVQIHVTLLPDGTVSRAEIIPDPARASDSFYQSAAESARRAVLAASPIQIPPGKYDALKDLTMNFTPPRNSLR
jgi:outer membrane biosynthesis protein TonB